MFLQRDVWKLNLLIPAIATVCACLVASGCTQRDNEPAYEGKPLSYWTAGLAPTGADSQLRLQCQEAVRQIGTNAIPFLLRWIQYNSASGQASKPGYPYGIAIDVSDSKMVLAYGSAHAFEVLGAEAEFALPELARLANSFSEQNNRYLCIQALARIGPSSLPALISVATNRNNDARTFAISAIGVLGTNAEPAVLALIDLLRDPDESVAAYSANTLGDLHLKPQVTIPPLQSLLRGTRALPRLSAMNALSMFGSQANAAVPDVARFLTDPDERMRSIATNALLRIAPEVLTNTPPNCSSAPLRLR